MGCAHAMIDRSNPPVKITLSSLDHDVVLTISLCPLLSSDLSLPSCFPFKSHTLVLASSIGIAKCDEIGDTENLFTPDDKRIVSRADFKFLLSQILIVLSSLPLITIDSSNAKHADVTTSV